MLEREEGLVYTPKLGNVIVVPETSSGHPLLPQKRGQESERGVLSDNNAVRLKKRDVSAVRNWPRGCGRNVQRIKMLKQGEKVTVVGGALDPLLSPTNGVAFSIPGDSEQLEPSQTSLIKRDQSSRPSIVSKVNQVPVSKEWPCRSISAVREWPLHCGRNVLRVGREECLQCLAERKKSVDGQKVVVQNKLSNDISYSKHNDENLDGRIVAETMSNLQVGDVPIEKLNSGNMNGASNKSQEEGEDVIRSPQRVAESRKSTKMVEMGDQRMEVKVDKSKQILVEVIEQVVAETTNNVQIRDVPIDKLNSGNMNGVMKKSQEEGEDAIGSPQPVAESCKPIKMVDMGNRRLEEKGDKSKKMLVEVGKQIQVRASSESQLPPECQRSNSSQVTEKMQAQAANNYKLLRLKSKLKPSTEMFDDDIRTPKVKVASLEKNANFFQEEELVSLESSQDNEVVLALKAAPNCPWQQGKRCPTPNAVGSVSCSSGKKGKRTSETYFLPEDKVDHESQSPAQECRSLSLAFSPSGIVFEDEDSQPEDMEDDEGTPLLQECRELNVSIIPFGTSDVGTKAYNQKGIVTRKEVRETLRLFQACCRKLLQEAEAKDRRNSNKRVDMLAYEILKHKNKFVNTGKPILGIVPGVEVGDEFHYRSELCIIGLHRQTMAGIDCLREGRYLATSIVSSGKYDDQMDSSDVLIYTGQGGRPSAKNVGEDQKLTRGNLALKNSLDAQTPVRVIRGIKEAQYKDKKQGVVTTYIYYGLYLVEEYWSEKGSHGFLVYKYKLRRIPGQPNLAVREAKKLKKSKAREGICVVDISGGKEKIPICVVNTIDNEKPLPFTYITKMMYPTWYEPVLPKGCSCTNGCSDSEKCICAVKNGGEIPYNYNGAIVQAKPIVYECGPSCRCRSSCHNRVSQHGIKFQLEVFKTENRGWGVRSLTSIPSGSFICEYMGEVLLDTEAEQRTGNDEYLFDIGHNHNDGFLQGELSTVIPNLHTNSICEIVEDSGFTIDAATYGNVGRFVNHSCSPNLYAQNVFYDHEDKRLPHILLFAAENIPPLQELTYHYNYTLDHVRDSNGNVKKKQCCCGSLECTGRLY